jgi:hypothetical protein
MAPAQLTEYEQRQIEKIAGWKAEPPSYVSAVLEKVTKPLVKAVEHLVPPDTIAAAIENAYASSEIQTHRVAIARRAEVKYIGELLEKDLEFCNGLADIQAWESAEKAMFWGAAAGSPNPISTLVSLNALMTYCLKTIHSIGYCYGFCPDEPHERPFVLGILLIACASTLKEKQEATVSLGKVQDMIFEEAFEDLLQDVVVEEIVTSAGLSTIPLIGMLTGAMHSATLTEHTAAVAKYCFIERWLRYHQKVDSIAPDRKRVRSVIGRSRLRIANSVYWGTFGVTFLICVPLVWLVDWIPSKNPVFEGLSDGRADARDEAVRLVEKLTATQHGAPVAQSLLDAASV